MKRISQSVFTVFLFLVLFLLFSPIASAKDEATQSTESLTSAPTLTAQTLLQSDTLEIRGAEGSYTAYTSAGEVYAEREALADLLLALPEGELIFSDVASSETISLTRSFFIEGELSVKTLCVEGGATVTMERGTLNASVHVKNGSFILLDGEIVTEEESAVVLNYMASATFHMYGGTVKTSGTQPCIDLTLGSAYIGGGSIENTEGSCVRSGGTLTLYNSPTLTAPDAQLVVSRPVHLSFCDIPYEGSLRIMTDSAYPKGSFSVVCYDAVAEHTECITLLDQNAKEQELSFYENAPHTTDKNVLAVALPYRIDFCTDGVPFCTQWLYDGESIVVPTAQAKEGFRFVAYRGEDGEMLGEAVATGDDVYESVYALLEPSFGLQGLSFTYDGLSRALSVSELSHPLSADGYFTYRWYKNGEILSTSSDTVSVRNVGDSGLYCVEITFTYCGENVSVESGEVTVKVDPLSLDSPVIGEKVYDGTHLYANVLQSPYYTVTENTGGTHAGEYSVTLTLSDVYNTVWSDNAAGTTVSIPFYITRAENAWTQEGWILDSYLGVTPEFFGYAKFGSVYVEYAKEKLGPYSPILPGSAGEYYARLAVEGTDDYTSLVGEPTLISIVENRVVSIRVETLPDKVSYCAFDTVDLTGIKVCATYLDGTVCEIDPGALRIIYNQYTSYLGGGDSGVTLAYLDTKTHLALSVRRAVLDMSSFCFESGSLVYTGEQQTLAPLGTLPATLDGSVLKYRIEGGATDVGTYTVTLSFSCDSTNYETPSDVSATLTILPKTVELTWEMLSFVYDGTAKVPKASFVNVWGKQEYVTVEGAKTAARTGYVATASASGGNYVFQNTTASFDIEKANYDLSGVAWSASSFSYDNTEKTVTLLGLPSGISVVGYSQNKATNAGAYTASATLAYDTENYNAPIAPSHTWCIEKISYDLSGFEVLGGSFLYDGTTHFPTVVGTVPTGLDGIAPTYSFSGGVCNVSDGTKQVKVIFATASLNYNVPESLTVSLSVTPAPVQVTWENLSFTYDGTPHAPVASCIETAVTVTGGGVCAGQYVATATAQNGNFYVVNAKVSYVVQKARNEWILPLSVSSIYTSAKPMPSAVAKDGTVTFTFYNGNGDAVLSPEKTPGKYTCVATVSESENYLALSSGAVSFEVIAVVCTGIEATLNGEVYYAYELLTKDDITAYLCYNDGTRELIDAPVISYRSGASLRAADSTVTCCYLDYTAELPITVKKATLSRDEIVLSHTTVTYTGTPFTLTVDSLPEGVSLGEMAQTSFCDAGRYEVTLTFLYDESNYEPIEPIVHVLTVERKTVALPTISDFLYDGTLHDVTVAADDAYRIETVSRGKEAGAYSVVLVLTDPKNTVFAGDGGERAEIVYYVRRAPLTVKLGDVTVYSDGTMSEIGYEIVDGILYGGDTLTYAFSVTDRVTGVFTSPNYEIVVLDGALIHSTSLSPEKEAKVLLLLLLIVILILLLILLTVRADSIRCYLRAHFPKRKKATAHPRGAVARDGAEPSRAVVVATQTTLVPQNTRAPQTPLGEEEARDTRTQAQEGSLASVDDSAENTSPNADVPTPEPTVAEPPSESAPTPEATATEPSSESTPTPEPSATEPSSQSAPTVEDAPQTAIATLSCDEERKKAKKKRKAAKRKKAVRGKSEEKKSIFHVFFAPWHKLGGRHAERTVAHRTQEADERYQSEMPSVDSYFGINVEEADRLLSDRSAEALLERLRTPLVTYGRRKAIINLDTLAEHFSAGERIDIEILKSRALIPYDTLHIKVLARGTLAKPLLVYANEFSLSAVKMLLLTGGKAIRQKTKSVGLGGGVRTRKKKN